jgi:hypothetical protein
MQRSGAFKIFRTRARRARDGLANYLAIESELWSMVTPTPMVELSEIFCRYWPLACAGLALIRSASSACRLPLSAAVSKLALPIVQWMMPP